MSSKKRTRERLAERRRKDQIRNYIIFGVVGVIVVGFLVVLIVLANRPRAGEAVDIMPNAAQHVNPGQTVDYSTNPPTSGPHYAQSAEPGFYQQPIPDGHLVHSLEHGYVIIWYDCSNIDEVACQGLQDEIAQTVSSGTKLIGMPREGMETPLALTSWGRIMRLDYWNESEVRSFIRSNLNNAPEPNAQ